METTDQISFRSELKPGDLGWIVERHGTLYASEYGWDVRFEGLVAQILGAIMQNYNPDRDRCWIAEQAGTRVGCVFLIQQSATVAKLRLLLVEPSIRGRGVGARLVQECIAFAQQAGYQSITLWTNDILLSARQLYQRNGFRLVHAEAHQSFGHRMVGETWELSLIDSQLRGE